MEQRRTAWQIMEGLAYGGYDRSGPSRTGSVGKRMLWAAKVVDWMGVTVRPGLQPWDSQMSIAL